MKYTLFFWVLFFNTTFMFSQSEYKKSVDSLHVLIDNTDNNEVRIRHYKELCDIYKDYDLAAFRTSNAVLFSIAKKANSAKGYGFYYCNQSKLIAYTNLQEAINYAEKGKQQFYKSKDWNNYIYACSLIGNHLNANGEYDRGIQLLQKTLPLAIKIDSDYLSYLYHELSKLYRSSRDDVHAIYYAKKGLTCKKPLKNKYLIYHCIAVIYLKTERYDKALEYNELAMRFVKSVEAKYSVMYRRAEILISLNRSNEGLPLLMKCLQYYEKQKAILDILDTQYMIASSHYKLGNYKKANYYIDEVLDFPTLLIRDKIYIFCLKADICLALNDIATANLYINKALSLLNNDATVVLRTNVYNIKRVLEKKLGNYKVALDYQEKIIAIKEANYKNDNKNKMYELETDLGFTEKNNRIKNLQIAQLKKQVEINTKSNYIIYISIALFIALASIVAYIKNYNTIKIKNVLIENEKSLVKKSLLEKETLLKEIHHRVKNNMQLVISLLKIQARDSKELSIENFIEVSENRIRSMALIHEYLYESENINYVNFEEYVNRLSSSIRGSFSNQSTIKLETQINNSHFNIETAIPLGLIINELVINAFKHAFIGKEQGIIKIILFNEQDLHHLEITDNGTGIDTIEENGSSIGLKIVKLLVSQINGQMQIKKNSGTQFTIQFKDINSTHE